MIKLPEQEFRELRTYRRGERTPRLGIVLQALEILNELRREPQQEEVEERT